MSNPSDGSASSILSRTPATRNWESDNSKMLPLLTFLVIMAGVLSLHTLLKMKERESIVALLTHEVDENSVKIQYSMEQKIQAFQRMAARWNVRGGTPYKEWQSDAKTYIENLEGLKTLEWVDQTYHIRWVEPEKGNESLKGQRMFSSAKEKVALRVSVEQNIPTVTAPTDMIGGYKGFIVYQPLRSKEKLQGFLAAVFSIEEAIRAVIRKDYEDDFNMSIRDNSGEFLRIGHDKSRTEFPLTHQQNINFFGQSWHIEISPTDKFIEENQTFLPTLVLISGALISIFLALTIRYGMVSQLTRKGLIEAKRMNDAILASTRFMMIATDPDGKILVFNKQSEDMMGYHGNEILNRIIPRKWLNQEEFVKKYKAIKLEFPDAEMNFDVFSKRPARDGVEVSEWTFVRSNGQHFPVRLTVTPIKNEFMRIVGYLGVAEDITELRQQRDALRESEEMFRSAMEGASIGMALVQQDGKWLKVNHVLCQLLGYTPEEFLNLDFQNLTHPDDLEEDLEFVKKTLAGEIDSYQMEKRYFHKNGNIIWALLSVSLIRTTDGTPKYFVSQIQDITERKQMDRMKSEFISVVSHELRTPLTSIRGSLGLIEGALSKDVPEKVLKLVSLANRNSERLILLINYILDLDKITAGEMQFDMKSQPLDEIITQAVETTRAYAAGFQVTYRIDQNPQGIKVDVDASRLNQVLINLLSNAAKFSPQGGEVIVLVERKHHSVRVSVIDKGPGISHEFRARIFDKFAQADSSVTREKGGTGLGLHISKMMIERMGGEISFISEVGRGATFWVELPIEQSVS